MAGELIGVVTDPHITGIHVHADNKPGRIVLTVGPNGGLQTCYEDTDEFPLFNPEEYTPATREQILLVLREFSSNLMQTQNPDLISLGVGYIEVISRSLKPIV